MDTPSFVQYLENHSNIFAVISMAVEFPLVLAFSFDISIPWPPVINRIFRFFLFNFPDVDNIGYLFGFWLAVIFVIFQVNIRA